MQFNFFPLTIYMYTYPIAIGILMRIPKLLMEIKYKIPWKFDWIRLVAIAIPTFFIILLSILPHIDTDINMPFPEFWFNLFAYGSPFVQQVAGIVLGYTILDVLKENQNQ
ncbi:hypothetical protein ACFQ4N_09695 [Oceanobacillus iheyensis]|uniref:Uncharacterized protein n=2 Tax=Oceanobacillus iheyensis TaxID=182710 RepID=Q8ERN6_OCEIH|nr:hypothetical protein [Oceanobacillus iheyensis HTE831]